MHRSRSLARRHPTCRPRRCFYSRWCWPPAFRSTGGPNDRRRRYLESVRADEAEETAQSVERLNHRGDQRGVAAVARKHLADREFQAADQLFGLLLFLVGHVGGLLRRSEHTRFAGRQPQPRSQHVLAPAFGFESPRAALEQIRERDDADNPAIASPDDRQLRYSRL